MRPDRGWWWIVCLSLGVGSIVSACPAGVGPPGEQGSEKTSGSERTAGDGSSSEIFDPRKDLDPDQGVTEIKTPEGLLDPSVTESKAEARLPEETSSDLPTTEMPGPDAPRPDRLPERRPEGRPESVSDQGQTGDPCASPCDCKQGLDCQQGRCAKATLPIYCCEGQGCPPGEACITRAGQSQRCSSTPTCRTHCDCRQGLGCYQGTCQDLGTPIYCCSKAGCPVGESCFDTSGTPRACPNPQGPATCKHTCDCPAGLVCVNGTCYRFQYETYCCDNVAQCPSGEYCVSRTSGSGYCPVTQPTCKGSCDCKFGEICFNGKCIATQQAPYCCQRDAARCPSGDFCEDALGGYQICGSNQPCTTVCDCGPNETCFNGTCVGSPQSLACCLSPLCRRGETCIQPSGSFDICR